MTANRTVFTCLSQRPHLQFACIGIVALGAQIEPSPLPVDTADNLDTIVQRMLLDDDVVARDEVFVVQRAIRNLAPDAVEEVLGRPQALLCRRPDMRLGGDRICCYVAYYGYVPAPEEAKPLPLGPIEITYSQYDKVLGAVLNPHAGARPGSSGKRVSLADQPGPQGDSWATAYAKIKAGMSRAEVDRLLGTPQAYNRLLVEPYATGPSIAHVEVFYGPTPMGAGWKPIVLGPLRVRFTAIDREGEGTVRWSAGELDYRRKMEGLSVQSWPDALIGAGGVPGEDGWAARYRRIKIGMPRSEVEQILGRPWVWDPAGRAIHSYGPSPRLDQLISPTSTLGWGYKIRIEYSSKSEVKRKRYNRDSVGYEAAQFFQSESTNGE